MNDIFKFNILVCLYLLFEKNIKNYSLRCKINEYGNFTIYEIKKNIYKITQKEFKSLYDFSYQIIELYEIIILSIEDYINIKRKNNSFNFDFLIKKNNVSNFIYNDFLQIILALETSKNLLDASFKLYQVFKQKEKKMLKIYLLYADIIYNIKKSSAENIELCIFNQEPFVIRENCEI